MRFRSLMNAGVGAVISVFLVLSSAEAGKNTLNIDFDKCEQAAFDHLGQFGVKNDDVESFNFVEVAEGGGGKRGSGFIRIVGIEYWMRIKQCEQGAVIIEVNEHCTVRQAYSRRGCKIEGIKSFR